jgi:hypothetical protein
MPRGSSSILFELKESILLYDLGGLVVDWIGT